MKKLISFMMALGMVAFLAACETNDVEPDEAPVVTPTASPTP